jgi:hypothetical protein
LIYSCVWMTIVCPFVVWSLYCLSFDFQLCLVDYCLSLCLSIWSWYCLSFDLQLCLVDYCLSLCLSIWSLYCLSFDLRLPISPLVFSNFSCYALHKSNKIILIVCQHFVVDTNRIQMIVWC